MEARNRRHGLTVVERSYEALQGIPWAKLLRLRQPLEGGPYSRAAGQVASGTQLLLMPPSESGLVNVRLE
jgi:hypothetical protein